jgi:hypothetical protein
MPWFTRKGELVDEPHYVQRFLKRILARKKYIPCEAELSQWEQLAHESPSHLHTVLFDDLQLVTSMALETFLLEVRKATARDNTFYRRHTNVIP